MLESNENSHLCFIAVVSHHWHAKEFVRLNYAPLSFARKKKNLCGRQRLQMLSCYQFKNRAEFLRFLSLQYHISIARCLVDYRTKSLTLSKTFRTVLIKLFCDNAVRFCYGYSNNLGKQLKITFIDIGIKQCTNHG